MLQYFYLCKIWVYFRRAEIVVGEDKILLTTAASGWGLIESPDGEWLLTWSSFQDGVKVLRHYCHCMESGMTYEEYIDSCFYEE